MRGNIGNLIEEMLEMQGVEGVVEGRSGKYIASFDAFYRFVAERYSSDVASPDADNPFPGLLPGKKYGRLKGAATQPSDRLIWSAVASFGMNCNGSVGDTVGPAR